jgi:phosphate transport system protein
MASGLRSHFDKQLIQLTEDTLRLGCLAHREVGRAMKALVDRDDDLAREVIAADDEINRLRYDIETQCYAMLATEQPVARDMRRIVAALTVASDLERVGDHGKRIARIWLRMHQHPQPIPLADLPLISDLALDMLDRALRALAEGNVAEAQAVCRVDDRVDALYKQTFNLVLSYMLENPRLIDAGTHLIQIAHELERVGDRATNVAERVIYSATGELVDLNN